jgi:hypothetical protein
MKRKMFISKYPFGVLPDLAARQGEFPASIIDRDLVS